MELRMHESCDFVVPVNILTPFAHPIVCLDSRI